MKGVPVRSDLVGRLISRSARLLMAARSSFESGEVAASLFDILTLAFLAFFVVVFFGVAGCSFFILGTAF